MTRILILFFDNAEQPYFVSLVVVHDISLVAPTPCPYSKRLSIVKLKSSLSGIFAFSQSRVGVSVKILPEFEGSEAGGALVVSYESEEGVG